MEERERERDFLLLALVITEKCSLKVRGSHEVPDTPLRPEQTLSLSLCSVCVLKHKYSIKKKKRNAAFQFSRKKNYLYMLNFLMANELQQSEESGGYFFGKMLRKVEAGWFFCLHFLYSIM